MADTEEHDHAKHKPPLPISGEHTVCSRDIIISRVACSGERDYGVVEDDNRMVTFRSNDPKVLKTPLPQSKHRILILYTRLSRANRAWKNPLLCGDAG